MFDYMVISIFCFFGLFIVMGVSSFVGMAMDSEHDGWPFKIADFAAVSACIALSVFVAIVISGS